MIYKLCLLQILLVVSVANDQGITFTNIKSTCQSILG